MKQYGFLGVILTVVIAMLVWYGMPTKPIQVQVEGLDLPTQTSIRAMVVAVTDGDTIRVTDGNNHITTVRLYGIDAPELRQRDGAASGRYLASRIGGEPVFIDAMSTDRYGRTVAMVYDRHQENMNEAMIQTGMAWVFRSYTNNQYWLELEQIAKQNRWGIWRRDTVIEPWVFRDRSVNR